MANPLEYDNFISSLLKGTPAARLEDELSPEELALQEQFLPPLLPPEPPPPQGMAESLAARSVAPPVPVLPPPAGMADSLAARSGDDMAKPTKSRLPALSKVGEPSMPTDVVQPQTTQPTSPMDLLTLMMMGRGSQRIGSAIAGTKADPNYLSELALIDKSRKEEADKALDKQAKQREMDLLKDADNPQGKLSELTRTLAKQYNPNLNVDGMSHTQLKSILPTLANQSEAKLAREARLEAAKILAEGKKETQEAKKDEKKMGAEGKLADKIAKADTDTGYSAGRAAMRSIREAQASGKWDSTMDIETLYRFIKLLDPGSVVREGEIQLASKGESVLGSITKQPGRITKGDILSAEFRKKLAAAIERNYNNSKKDFDDRIAPFKKQVEEYELDLDNIVSQNILYPETGNTSPNGMVRVREKSTGRMKDLSPEKAATVLKNSNYEKVSK